MIRFLRNLWCRWRGHRWEATQPDWREALIRFGPLAVLLGGGLEARRCRRCGLLEGKMEL